MTDSVSTLSTIWIPQPGPMRPPVDGTTQAFNRMLGASFVTLSDRASQDLASAGLVRTYPDAPRITIASSVISMSKQISQTARLQVLDLLHDSVRAIAYPGQARGAEQVYRMTRGVCNTFMESAVGEALTGEYSKSTANVLQAAQDQDIPLAYVDADHLDVLARLEISTQAKAFIVDAVQQGYGVIVPERMVAWDGGETIAWWQLDLETGEMVGVGENGTHGCLITCLTIVLFTVFLILFLVWVIVQLWRIIRWRNAAYQVWDYFEREVERGLVDLESENELQKFYLEALRKTKIHFGLVLP